MEVTETLYLLVQLQQLPDLSQRRLNISIPFTFFYSWFGITHGVGSTVSEMRDWTTAICFAVGAGVFLLNNRFTSALRSTSFPSN
jgi:hypothetical protein